MSDIIKIKKSLEDSIVLNDGDTQTKKNEINKTIRWVSWSFVSTFKGITRPTFNLFSTKNYEWKRS